LLLCVDLRCLLSLSVKVSMPPVIGLVVFWKIIKIVVWVCFRNKAICLCFIIFLIALVLLVDFSFDIKKLIPWVTASSFPWPTLLSGET